MNTAIRETSRFDYYYEELETFVKQVANKTTPEKFEGFDGQYLANDLLCVIQESPSVIPSITNEKWCVDWAELLTARDYE